MNINKVLIYGNITKDIELKKLPSGVSVVNTSVATNNIYTDKSGNRREDAEFHNIVIFGKQAELVSQYLSKGSGVFIEGRLQTRSWESEGSKRYITEIIAERVQFGPKSSGSSSSPKKVVEDDINQDLKYPSNQIDPEDIPF